MPGAEVWFVERDDARREQREQNGPWQLLAPELAEHFGEERRTDDEGHATLPAPRNRLYVAARHGDRFAFTVVGDHAPEEVTLELVHDEVLQLLVLDGAGQPAPHVPIAVWCADAKGRPDRIWEGNSDDAGRAQVAHFQVARPKRAVRFGAALRFPLADPTPTEFRGDPVPNEPVVVRMPACGSVELTVVDRTGAPLLAMVSVALHPVRDKSQRSWLPDWADSSWTRKPEGAESVTFTPVAVGTRLRVGARLEDRNTGWRGDEVYQGRRIPARSCRSGSRRRSGSR